MEGNAHLVMKVAFGGTRMKLERKSFMEISAAYEKWYVEWVQMLLDSNLSLFLEEVARTIRVPGRLPANTAEFRRILLTFLQNVERPEYTGIVKAVKDTYLLAYVYGIETFREDIRNRGMSEGKFRLTDPAVLSSIDVHLNGIVAHWLADVSRAMVFTAIRMISETLQPIANTQKAITKGQGSVLGSMVAQGQADWRARRTAVTLVQQAIGKSRSDYASRSGFTFKRRQTVGDERVRPKHSADERAGWIPIDSLYPATGVMYVGEGVDGINCRCVSLYSYENKGVITPWDGSSTGATGAGYSEEGGVVTYNGKELYREAGVQYVQAKEDKGNAVVEITPAFAEWLLENAGGFPDGDPETFRVAIRNGVPVTLPSLQLYNNRYVFDSGISLLEALIMLKVRKVLITLPVSLLLELEKKVNKVEPLKASEVFNDDTGIDGVRAPL